MQKIILINGKKRHGKDHLARMLQAQLIELGARAEIMAFADPIKSILSKTLDISEANLDKFKNNPDRFLLYYMCKNKIADSTFIDEKLKEVTMRSILQRFGTEAMKEWLGEDVWVNLLKTRAQRSNAEFIIVPDFRFSIEHISPYTIKIKNDDIQSNDTHRSEIELNDFHFKYIIDNTGKPDISMYVRALAKSLISI